MSESSWGGPSAPTRKQKKKTHASLPAAALAQKRGFWFPDVFPWLFALTAGEKTKMKQEGNKEEERAKQKEDSMQQAAKEKRSNNH